MLYEYIPQKNMKQAGGLMTLLISASVGFFLFPSMFPDMPLRWVFQLSGVACLAALIFVVVRYIERAFIYRIVEEEGALYLTVTEVTRNGRSRVMVCHIDIAHTESAYLVESEEEKALDRRARGEKRKRFDFRPDTIAPLTLCIFAKENGEDILIKLTGDAKLFSYFEKAVDSREEN